MIFFTSDTHFYHQNIIKYCNRPFNNVLEMNEIIITNWNSVVKKDDVVYHLGDFGLFGGKNSRASDIFYQLNGSIHLIKGNHDTSSNLCYVKDHFKSVKHNKCITFFSSKGYCLILNHYPTIPDNQIHMTWKTKERTGICYLLHGHSHHTQYVKQEKRINVGVDLWNFTPVSIYQIDNLIQNKL